MEPEKEIEALRGEIDEIDRKIVRLLCKRFEAVARIAGAKRALGVSVEDAERERHVLRNCIQAAGDALDEDFVEKFTSLVLEESKKIQRGSG